MRVGCLQNDSRLARVIDISGITEEGVGFIEANGAYGCVFVEVSLPTTNLGTTGISTFEDWLRILRATKDDLNQEALLRLNFAQDQDQGLRYRRFQGGQAPRNDGRRAAGAPTRDPMGARTVFVLRLLCTPKSWIMQLGSISRATMSHSWNCQGMVWTPNTYLGGMESNAQTMLWYRFYQIARSGSG